MAYQEALVELEVSGALLEELVYTIQPLEEDGTASIAVFYHMTRAIKEPMTKPNPLPIHKYLKSLKNDKSSYKLSMLATET